MNLHKQLLQRASIGKPVRVGLIGAGKFGSMYLSQARRTAGIHVTAIADLYPHRSREALLQLGWPAQQIRASSFDDALKHGSTFITDDANALIASNAVEVVIDATGSPAAGIAHVLRCCEHGKHIVMVNVEADALAGPLLAKKAREAGIVYSLAYGDQPALICEMVDWARTAGFEVVAAGKGTKYLPEYHASTPETVWRHYGLSPADAAAGGLNPQMFNSFLDGTKSAIEMAAVSNATGLTPAPQGLEFPPCGVDDLARVLRPKSEGGSLHHRGQVEVISSLERDGQPVMRDLRWGVYVTFAADSDYVRRCFKEYGLVTDPSGNYSSMYKPFHLIGLELGISVASVALRREATGSASAFNADVVATAKRALKAGERLDGEGGHTVYGKLMPARDSLAAGALPLGLAHGIALKRDIEAGQALRWSDVEIDAQSEAVRVRREMERLFAA
jgi:predicted homoserine dehydrogenase-like protein